jgi:hypothetical protein
MLALTALLVTAAAAPALAAGNDDYKGWFVALDLANTQPNSLDQHYANHVVTGTTPVTDERLVLENDADFTYRATAGYSWGKDKGALMVSYWSFDNEDTVDGNLIGGVYPTIFGYGYYGGMYIYNPGAPGVSFTAASKVQASTIDLDYVRPVSVTPHLTVKWLAGLRVASYEEDQAFTGTDNGYYGYYDGTQTKHFKSDGFGLRVGVKASMGIGDHFSIVPSAVFSFMQADTAGNSRQEFVTGEIETNQATDDNIKGEIRDFDVKAMWSYGKVDYWLGYAMSAWDGMVTDPVPGNEGGHLAAGPIDSRSRDSISFNSLHAGMTFRFGKTK